VSRRRTDFSAPSHGRDALPLRTLSADPAGHLISVGWIEQIEVGGARDMNSRSRAALAQIEALERPEPQVSDRPGPRKHSLSSDASPARRSVVSFQNAARKIAAV